MEEDKYVDDDSFKNGFNPFGSKTVGIILLVFIILGGLGCVFFFYVKPTFLDKEDNLYLPNNNDNEDKTTTRFELNESTRDKTESYTNTLVLDIYYNDNNHKYSICSKVESNCEGSILKTINIPIKDELDIVISNYFTNYLDKYVLYQDDNKVKLYDVLKNISYVTEVESNHNHYDIAVDNRVLGIVYGDNNINYYYAFKTSSIIYKEEYAKLDVLIGKYLVGYVNETNDEGHEKQKYIDILNAVDGSKLQTIITPITVDEKDEVTLSVDYYRVKSNTGFIAVGYGKDEITCKEVYTDELKFIVDCSTDKTPVLDTDNVFINAEGNLQVNKDGVITIYDVKGNILTN